MKSRLLFILGLIIISSGIFAQISTVGIIGSATPGDWATETPMTRVDDSTWTIDITLIDGDAKFRADDGWAVNWGAKDFPKGIGTQDGANIPVFAGDYTISFNSNSGAYFFDVDSDISIIGSATVGGWADDTKMYQNQADSNKFFIITDLVSGDAKFRTTGSWARNWGSPDFPTGVGVQEGANIPIVQAGQYEIHLDTLTGEYSFEELVAFESIGIIGDATPGGWATETPLTKSNTNPDLWRVVIVLVDGLVKFRANDSWTLAWGGTDFPSGTASETGGDIPVTAGEYIVTFNTNTLEYNFVEVVDYETIGLIGSATPGGWESDSPMNKDGNDKTIWKLRLTMVDGEAKFRADTAWTFNWGGSDFPEGIAELDGPNIPVPAGDYFVDFNSATGAYKFTAVVEYEKISLVGKSGPFGDWPGDDDSRDTYLTKDAGDFNLWTHTGMALTGYEGVTDAGVKFRANAAWDVNWGAEDFPSGIGVQSGPNIRPVAGTYSVVFRSDTGEYAFVESSNTHNVLDNAVLNIYPNPTNGVVTIEKKENILSGDVQIKVLNTVGQLMFEQIANLENKVTVPVQHLIPGSYIIMISNDKNIISRNITIVK
ncbi:MAG: SusF/SusE family outer membrane protein [Saprospiraceae bacterium]